MRHDSASRPPSRRTLRQTGGTLALTLAFGACRGDGVTAPAAAADPACHAGACDGAEARPALGSAVVSGPIEDVLARIAPHVQDARTRVDLARTVDGLLAALRAGDRATARMRLAYVHDAIAQADARRRAGDAAAAGRDGADLDAIRLALVPAAQALDVASR